MARTLKLFISLLLIVSNVSALNSQQIKSIDPGIVLVARQVYFPESDSSELALWAKLEKHLGTRIINEYLNVSTGTGFYVDGQGHILTNFHVIDNREEARSVKDLIASMQSYLAYKVPDEVLSVEERFKLRIDISKVLKNKRVELRAMTRVGAYYRVSPLASDEKLDLALLKLATDEKTIPLPLYSIESPLDIGASVTAAGYPLAGLFDSIFKDKAVSFTQGNVSAIRDDIWGIQHTAALNPGNSGGPLLDSEGFVVGVNVGTINDANSLFFAIDTKRILGFFRESGHFGIFESNRSLFASEKADPVKGALMERHVGESIIINSERDAEVFLDGKLIGKVPQILSLSKETSLVRVRGAAGESSVILHLDRSIAKATTVEVELASYTEIVHVTTNPPGAYLTINGIAQGAAPKELALPVGKHLIQAKADGYIFEDREIVVLKDKKTSVELKGIKTAKIGFSAQLPLGTRIIATSKDRVLSFIDPATIEIPEGVWSIKADNPEYFNAAVIELDTKTASKIETSPWYEMGKIRFSNVLEGSSLYVDGEYVGPVRNGVEYPIPCGIHTVTIAHKDYLDFSQPQRVVKSTVPNVKVVQTFDKKVLRRKQLIGWGVATVALCAVGVPALAYGASESHYDIAEMYSNIFFNIGGYALLGGAYSGWMWLSLYMKPVE